MYASELNARGEPMFYARKDPAEQRERALCAFQAQAIDELEATGLYRESGKTWKPSELDDGAAMDFADSVCRILAGTSAASVSERYADIKSACAKLYRSIAETQTRIFDASSNDEQIEEFNAPMCAED